MDIRKRVGLNIQRLRKERGWSQEAFGDEAGIDRTYVSGVERGIRNPTITVLERFAVALGVEPAELLRAPPNHPGASRRARNA
jgi:transcriptional regulator with XRE-family HTH domain